MPEPRCSPPPTAVDALRSVAARAEFAGAEFYAREALAGGWPVIVDAAFLRRDERQSFRALAQEQGVPFTILACRADSATLQRRERLRRREDQPPRERETPVP